MSEIGKNFQTRRDRKTKIKIKINLIYYSKLTSNVVGREIRKKTQILIRDNVRIDPIALRIKGFSKSNFRHSSSDFSPFSQQNLTFKHSSDTEIDLDDKESKRFKD